MWTNIRAGFQFQWTDILYCRSVRNQRELFPIQFSAHIIKLEKYCIIWQGKCPDYFGLSHRISAIHFIYYCQKKYLRNIFFSERPPFIPVAKSLVWPKPPQIFMDSGLAGMKAVDFQSSNKPHGTDILWNDEQSSIIFERRTMSFTSNWPL